MNKKEFASALAENANISKAYALLLVDYVLKTLSEALDTGEDIYLCGFGKFKHEMRKSKIVRHPKTGELMEIKPKDIITFRRTIKNEEQISDEE